MNINQIRLHNLAEIVEDRFNSNWTRLSEAIEKSTAHVSIVKSGTRAFSEKFARHIEEKLELPRGYLDKDHTQREEETPEGKVRIPVYDLKTSAGTGSYVHAENIVDHAILNESILSRYNAEESDLSIVKVDGNSMMPTLFDGEEILVNHSIKSGIDNRVFIISTSNEIWVKRFRKTPAGDTWESDNEEYRKYDHMYNGKESEVLIIGLVLRSLGRDI